MRRRLRDEPQYRALNAPAAVPLRWRVRRPIVASRSEGKPADGGGGPEAFADWMSRAGVRRAALIGAAGAGKTTFVALVARAMLEPDGRDIDRPAPVIVSLADWDPRVDSLAAWIALRLAAEFPELDDDRDGYGRDISLALVQHREVWPILDGLDEVRDELVSSAVEQLRDLPASTPVLVTCRTDKFEELVGDGRLAPGMETVELEPLAGADVIPFLEAGVDDRPSAQRQPWERLTDRLRAEPDDPLTIALDTPLIAWLLWALYGRDGRDPSVLLDRHALPTATAIEDHLLRDLLPMALSGSSSKEVGRAERWLGFIARRSEKREVRGITWWATPSWCRAVSGGP